MMARSYEENISAVNGIITILVSVAKSCCWWHLMCSDSRNFLQVQKTLAKILYWQHIIEKLLLITRRQIFRSQKYGQVVRGR